MKSKPQLYVDADIKRFTPTQAQIDTFARRLTPEIKKFFADEQIQKEFAKWQEKKAANK